MFMTRVKQNGTDALRRVRGLLLAFGFDPLKTWSALVGIPHLVKSAKTYRAACKDQGFAIQLALLYPCPSDYRASAGDVSGHYFFADLWAARGIFRARPRRHVDIGSRIDGFVAHVLAFMPVTVVDIRPLASKVGDLTFIRSDATTLDVFEDGTLESISSIHAVEHFGLGRYGDDVNPDAPFLAMQALARILKPGGRLYFGVPIGKERLEFNAHRVFNPLTVIRAFPNLKLRSFSAVDDLGAFHDNVDPSDFAEMQYACGLFEFSR